jgi:methane monooxygenase component A beta chain/propane monooxygenase small subunit
VALIFNCFDKERHAQDILFHQYDLAQAGCPIGSGNGRDAWLGADAFQPMRRLAERVNAAVDWVEVAVAVNLIVEPLLGRFLFNEILWLPATAHGDTLTPVLLSEAENDRQRNIAWASSLVALLIGDPADGELNRELLNGWIGTWVDPVIEAAHGLAPFAKLAGVAPERALSALEGEWGALLATLDLDVPVPVGVS